MKYCRHCGSELKNNNLYCTKCGAKIEDSNYNSESSKEQKRNKHLKIYIIILICAGIAIAVFALLKIVKNDSTNQIQTEKIFEQEDIKKINEVISKRSQSLEFNQTETDSENDNLKTDNIISDKGNDTYIKHKNLTLSPIKIGNYEYHTYGIYSVADVPKELTYEEFCEKQGGHLATINSPSENSFLSEYILKSGYPNAFFGLIYDNIRGTYEWVTEEPITYELWWNGSYSFDNANEFSVNEYSYVKFWYPDAYMEDIILSTDGNYLVENNIFYSTDNIWDNNLATAWVEGAEGYGIGETVSFKLNEYCGINSFSISNGYQKNNDLYEKNARPKDITIMFKTPEGVYSENIRLEDIEKLQTFEFSPTIYTNEITLEIDDVYLGTKYEDTAISEIRFDGVYLGDSWMLAPNSDEKYFVCEWDYLIEPY